MLTGRLRIAPDQRQQRLDDINGRQLRSLVKRMIIRRRIVSILALPFRFWRRRVRHSLGVIAAHRDHGGIVAGGVLLELGDIVDNVEAGILPEMALDEPDVMDPRRIPRIRSGLLECVV